jgi:hypothetical protein
MEPNQAILVAKNAGLIPVFRATNQQNEVVAEIININELQVIENGVSIQSCGKTTVLKDFYRGELIFN